MKKESHSPWFWIPSLYYAEGLPYIIAMTVSVIMYKTLGDPIHKWLFGHPFYIYPGPLNPYGLPLLTYI